MKTEYKIIGLSILFLMFVCASDAALDFLVFQERPFWDSLILDVPSHAIFHRSIITAAFLIFGFLAAVAFNRRKRAEAALRESEEKYRTIFEHSPLGIVHFDRHGIVTAVNECMAKITGTPKEHYTGFDLLTSLKNEGVKTACEAALAGKLGHYEGEYLSLFGGKHTIIKADMAPIALEHGTLSGGVAIVEDITERRISEEARRKGEEMLNGLLATSPVGIGFALNRKMTWVNDTWAKMFGFEDKNEFLGQSARMLYRSEEEYESIGEALYTNLSTGKVTEADVKFVRKDGSVFDALIRMKPLDPNDISKGTIAAISDVSARKQAEEALRQSEANYRAIFDAANDAIVVHDAETGEVYDVNAKLCEMSGYTREELLRRDMGAVHFAEAPFSQDEAMQRLKLAARGRPQLFEWPARHKDGNLIWVEVNLRQAVIGGENRVLAVIRDISERKRAEQEQEALRSQLLKAQKMEAIGTLAGGIAHDFNNMLTVILGYSELLSMDKNERDPDYADLQKIAKTARDGADVVRRLLTFSKTAKTRPGPVNLNDEVENVKNLLARSIPKMIEIKLHLAMDLAIVNADAGQIEQALMNLAVNAKDAMPDGGKLRIETKNVTLDEEFARKLPGAEPGDYVLLSVSDTGHGMDAATQERIFDPFFTTKGQDSSKGTGLGLAIAHGIIEQHRGYILCRSAPGEGTTFEIYFPAMKAQEKEQAETIRGIAAVGTETILLVDDEEFILDLGQRILSRSGYKVVTADNGKKALEICRAGNEKIDLIILDLIMPEMGGIQCLDEILKIDPEAKVLIASGYSSDDLPQTEVEAGAKGFVAKPYDTKQILRAIRQALDER